MNKVIFTFILIASCAHWSLPNRALCVTPWEQRKDCISNANCTPEERCAKRGSAIGKCTLVDCCEPWRGRPSIKSGYDWCDHKEYKKNGELK